MQQHAQSTIGGSSTTASAPPAVAAAAWPGWGVVFAVLAGLAFIANGLFMLWYPEGWYWSLETVPQTGPMNNHFIRDIGLAYAATGAAALAGAARGPASRWAWWGGAACWHLLHGALHTWEVLVGICTPAAYAKDFVPVVVPGVVLALLALHARAHRRRVE